MDTQIDKIRLSRKISSDWLLTPDQVKNFQLADFKNPEIYRRILETAADPQFNTEFASAGNFLSALLSALKPFDAALRQDAPALYADYQKIINYLQFICLPLDSVDEIEKLFAEKFLFAFDWGVDIEERIIFVMSFYSLQGVAIAGVQVPALRGLKGNREKLGERDIVIDNNNIPPYVSNWLKDYDYFSAGVAARRIIEEIAYVNQSANVRLLNADQKEILRKIIRVYNMLRFPVLLPSAETIATGHRLPSALPSVGERITEDIAKQGQMTQEILGAYRGSEAQQRAIGAAEAGLAKTAGNDKAKLRNEFFTAVQQKNADKTVACLRLLAQLDDLAAFLKDDVRLNKFITAVWSKKFGAGFLADFSNNPGQPRYIRAFLRYILEERLGLNSNDAARVGVQVGNILIGLGKNEYNKIAFFDVAGKKFLWFED